MVFDFFFQIKCIDRNKYCHLTVAVRDKLVSWRRRIYFFYCFYIGTEKMQQYMAVHVATPAF